MIRKGLLFSALLGMTTLTQAQVNIHIDTQNPGVRVSPNLYGIFYEDINHAADGGLYAELVRNRSFEDNDKTAEAWKTYQGATMTLVNSAKKQLNRAQKNYLEVNFTGKGTSGISNEGFWGINTVKGKTYKLSFWAKGKLNGNLKVYLGCNCGKKMFAVANINEKITNKWKKYTAEFTATTNHEKARLWITSEGKGTVDFDVVSLFPPTFNNRENGLRPDLASMLKALHPKFFRFPGGCISCILPDFFCSVLRHLIFLIQKSPTPSDQSDPNSQRSTCSNIYGASVKSSVFRTSLLDLTLLVP